MTRLFDFYWLLSKCDSFQTAVGGGQHGMRRMSLTALFSFKCILFILHFTCNLWQADYHINKLGRQFYFLLWCRANAAPQIRCVAAEKVVRSRKAIVFLWHGIRTRGQKNEILPQMKAPLSSFQYWPRTDIWEGIQEGSRYMKIQCQVTLQSCYTLQYRSFLKQKCFLCT